MHHLPTCVHSINTVKNRISEGVFLTKIETVATANTQYTDIIIGASASGDASLSAAHNLNRLWSRRRH